jgi:hypothetical protein
LVRNLFLKREFLELEAERKLGFLLRKKKRKKILLNKMINLLHLALKMINLIPQHLLVILDLHLLHQH